MLLWEMYTPYDQKYIIIDGITIIAPNDSPNTDGIALESSKNVVVKDGVFEVGEDGIVITAGRNQDGRRINVPTENVVIRHCTMRNGSGGLVLGNEMTGGVRQIFMEDCKMEGSSLHTAIQIKSNEERGGFIEDIFVRNIEIEKLVGLYLRLIYTII